MPEQPEDDKPLVGDMGLWVIVFIALAIAMPFSYDIHAQAAMDDAVHFWSPLGGPLIGFDLGQVRQNVFSLMRDAIVPFAVTNHGISVHSPMLGVWNFITQGRIYTVADALVWYGIYLTDKQAKTIDLCTPIHALGDKHVIVQPDPSEYGIASWYGPGFDAQLSASGETYNRYDLTAAHKSLPLGSLIRVVDQHTSRSVIVRINDRGPYVSGRIIDMSYAAKTALGMGDLASVYLEKLDPPVIAVACQQ